MYRLCALVACLALAAAACGGSAGSPSSGRGAPLPLWQRVIEGSELTGFVPDAAPPTVLDLDSFIDESRVAFVRITPQGARRELTSDGFAGALISGMTFARNKDVLGASVVVQLASSSQAQRMRDWSSNDSLQPCRNTCNVSIAPFDVPGIPGAKGAHRWRAAGAAGAGPTQTFESFDVGFTDGPFLYDVFVLTPRPGMVSQDTVLAAAKTLYQRVHDSPPLPSSSATSAT